MTSLASLAAAAGALAGPPRAAWRGATEYVPVVGWRPVDPAVAEDALAVVEPLALLVATAAGIRRVDVPGTGRCPPIDAPGGVGDALSDADRARLVDSVFDAPRHEDGGVVVAVWRAVVTRDGALRRTNAIGRLRLTPEAAARFEA